MSGGNSKGKGRSSKRQEGWEEAGGEFYQESYPGGGEQELLDNLQRTDAAKLATLLPSKRVRAGEPSPSLYSSSCRAGWEEAGGEFYQESYPGGGEQELLENLQRTDAAKLATLLPSKRVRAGEPSPSLYSSSCRAGWEEAGGEFYQESYPGGGEQELLENLQRTDAAKLATLLPSKRVRAGEPSPSLYSSSCRAGWEEAGGEFYQESYPGGGEQELLENLQRTDAAKLATLLPSKRVRAGEPSPSLYSSSCRAGWEEAGGEFYQESYPGGGEQELLENLQRTDAAKLATLLPSKRVRAATVKRVRSQSERRQSTYARTAQSHDVHLSMLPDLSENLSNEERTWEEIMLIKAMPVPMAQKLELKAQLQNATKLRLQGLEQLQWRQRKVWHQFRSRCGELIGKLELWRGPLKTIEGNFGTGVVAYFLFLRWLMFLNLAISSLIILFLILPKALLVDPEENCQETEPNSTVCCHEAYMEKGASDLEFLHVIQGTGRVERTLLFYGVYSNQIFKYYINIFGGATMHYNMPLAYILVPIAWFLFSLIAIVKSATRGFQERLVENEGQFYKYCNLVFGGWDFCIHNDKSSNIKHKALYNEIKCCLEEDKWKEEKQARSREEHILIGLKRVLVNLVVLAILAGSGVLIYVAFNFSINRIDHMEQNRVNGTSQRSHIDLQYLYSNTSSTSLGETESPLPTAEMLTDEEDWFSLSRLQKLFLEFLPALCIVGLNIVVPEIFHYLIKFENYMPAFAIKMSLLRTIFLRLSSLVVLLSQIYVRIDDPANKVCSAVGDGESFECWETYVGQQLYKLILTDFIVQFLTTFFINFPRSLLARHIDSRCFKIIGEQEFYLPKHVLDIVYTQTIIWMGAFFCPFLPIFGTVSYFIIFYIKKFACLVNSTPSPTVYRASKSKSMFMLILFLGFIVSICPVAYTIAEIEPSQNCGPFRGLRAVWDFVVTTFNAFPDFFRRFVFFFGTSAFAVPAFAVVILMLYYYWAVAAANRHMVTVLKSQLVLEGHDKQFLLNRLSAFIRQHQKRCERARNRASFVDDESVRQSSK